MKAPVRYRRFFLPSVLAAAAVITAAVFSACYYYGNPYDTLAPDFGGVIRVASVEDIIIYVPSDTGIITEMPVYCSEVLSDEKVYYRFQFATDAEFQDIKFDEGRDENNAYSDIWAGTWYVRAAARTGDGDWGSWSDAERFTAESLIAASDILITKVSANELKVDWPDVGGAEEYEIIWGYDADDWYDKNYPTVSKDFFWIAGTAVDWAHIYFRVSSDNHGVFSEAAHLTQFWDEVDPMDGGVCLQTEPLLDWEDITDAAGYEVEFSKVSAAALDGSDVRSASSSQYQLPAADALIPGEALYWRIRVLGPSGTAGAWSGPMSFEIKAALAVGDKYAGGYIFDLPGDGTGLCASLVDYETPYNEYFIYSENTLDISGAESLTDGAANTAAVLAATDFGVAARCCDQYSSGGYTDWFLPAENQLTDMCTEIGSNGTFSSTDYWSSTQVDTANAREVAFPAGTPADVNKEAYNRVRPARAFTY